MSQEEKFPHARMGNGRVRQPLRIGRVERDVALKVLEEAYVEERLTLVEYDERMGKVFSATTHEELDFIVEDLTPSSTRKVENETYDLANFSLEVFAIVTIFSCFILFLMALVLY